MEVQASTKVGRGNWSNPVETRTYPERKIIIIVIIIIVIIIIVVVVVVFVITFILSEPYL